MARSRIVLALVAVAVLAAAIALLRRDGDRRDGDAVIRGTVERAIDGDTISVWLDGHPRTPGNRRVGVGRGLERVRYIGIDTPESVKPGTPVECYAEAAHALNARLVEHRRVRLVADLERRDRYGRLLAYVYRDDDLFVNAELVRRGYAQPLTIPPNVRFARRFLALARGARDAGRGLWAAC